MDMADEKKRLLPGDIPKVLVMIFLFFIPILIVDPIIASIRGGGVFWIRTSEGLEQNLVVRPGFELLLMILVFILFLLSIFTYSRLSKINLKGFGFSTPLDLKETLLIGTIGGIGLMLLGDLLETLLFPIYDYFGFTSQHLEISTAIGRSVSNQGIIYIATIIIIIGVLDPIAEEIFFRGVFQTAFQNKNGFMTAAILSSIVFALAHFDLILFPIFFIMGFILAYSYYKTESILAPMLMHITNNTIVFILYMIGIERIFPIFYHLR